MRPTSVFKTRPCFSHHRRVTSAGWLASQRLSSRATYGPKVSKQFAVSTIQAWHGDNGHAALVVDVGAVTNLWTEILWGLADCTVVWMIALDKLWLDLIGCSNQIHNGKVFDTYIEPYFSWCSKCIYTSKHTSTRQVGWMIMIWNSCTIFQAGDSLQDWYELVLCTTNRPKCLPRSSFWWSPCHTHGQMYRLFPMILWERLFCSLHATANSRTIEGHFKVLCVPVVWWQRTKSGGLRRALQLVFNTSFGILWETILVRRSTDLSCWLNCNLNLC